MICAIPDCGKPSSKRGATCSPDCSYELRYGHKRSNPVGPPPNTQEEFSGNSWNISLDKTRIKSLDELVAAFKVDLQVWTVERFVVNKWEVGASPKAIGKSGQWERKSGDMKIEPLYQVKAWLVKSKAVAFAKNELASLKLDWDKRSNSIVKSKTSKARLLSGNLLELSIPDVHFGKLAWGVETGSDNYDTNIAIHRFEDSLKQLLHRTSGFSLDQIVLVLGNDLFHTDNRSNTTTKGTVVDTDSRYFKVFRKVRQLVIEKIEELRAIAPVRVVIVPGNHDEHSSWHLGDSLECWFRNYEDVEVDNEPISRKVYRFGEVMFMWLHGDKGKKIDYPLVMATEYRKMFGETSFHEIHCGHLHTESSVEKHGIMTRVLPSLCGTDYWHSSNHFVGNKKAAVAYVFNKKDGLIATGVYTVPEV